MSTDITQRPWRIWLAGALLAGTTLLSACGGGGDSGLIGGVGSGGTGAFSTGAIRGLGSIVVNGVRYDDSTATITDDSGGVSNSAQLQLGVVVEVQGDDIVTPATGLPTSTARSVVFRSEIKGPVSAVDAAAGSLTVLGQRVQTGATTVFDLSLPNGLAGVAVGQLVEVYGFVDANGVYQATRIEAEDSPSVYKIRGQLSALNSTARTFQIGAAVIDYSAISFNFTLVNGQTIRVEVAPTTNPLGQWVATKLNSATALGNAASSAASVELEGVVTSLTSARSFVVNGVNVDATNTANFPSGVAVGAQVEVKGKLENGVLVARRVTLEDDGPREFEVKGNIAALDPVAQTFQIRGMLIDYSAARFEDGTAANLSVDVRVEIKGRLNASGTVLQASEVEFKGLDDAGSNGNFEVKGSVAELDTTAQTFVVRGVTVNYSAARFDDGTVAQLAKGAAVEVKGKVSGGVLMANVVGFERSNEDTSDDTSGGSDDNRYELKGVITSLDIGSQTFVVNNVTVSYASARFEDGSVADVRLGARVEVQGAAPVNGVVAASEVDFDD